MQNRFDLLDTDVMPIFMIITLDIFITMHFSINCSAVICSPTIIHAIMREATSETYGPRVSFLLYCISFIIASRLLFCNLYFPIYIIKIPKIFILLSLSNLTFASDWLQTILSVILNVCISWSETSTKPIVCVLSSLIWWKFTIDWSGHICRPWRSSWDLTPHG